MMNTRFGEFGGQYIPEILMSEINHVVEAYEKYKNDPAFKAELKDLYANYTGRPSMLYEAKRMRADLGGPKIYLKREDLNHTGAHKINNCIGQALLAKRMGKTRLIAETGAGQHGVAAATVAALLGMECEIFMGEIDTERQALNVYRMRLLGAKVNAVKTGSRVLKDAVNAALQNWSARCDDTHYLIGSAVGPAPFPEMVRDFQCCIGEESKEQILEKKVAFRMPYLPVWAEAVILSAPFIPIKMIPMYSSSDVKPEGKGLIRHTMRQQLRRDVLVYFMV